MWLPYRGAIILAPHLMAVNHCGDRPRRISLAGGLADSLHWCYHKIAANERFRRWVTWASQVVK